MSDTTKADEVLARQCADFAREHGVDHLCVMLGDIYREHAVQSEDTAMQVICDMMDIEWVTVH